MEKMKVLEKEGSFYVWYYVWFKNGVEKNRIKIAGYFLTIEEAMLYMIF